MSGFHRDRIGLALLIVIIAGTLAVPSQGFSQETTEARDGAASGVAQPHPGLHGRVRAALERADRLFQRASEAFPSFCQDWEAKLRERERNNLSHIEWKENDGLKNGSYVGYSKVTGCACKQSAKGIPIGRLMYQEFKYQLEGKTLTEAMHALPKPAVTTNTTEIFRFDTNLNKWTY